MHYSATYLKKFGKMSREARVVKSDFGDVTTPSLANYVASFLHKYPVFQFFFAVLKNEVRRQHLLFSLLS